ncbi:hypothetical protein ACFWPU_04355 [Streptomyces sp. NPDC058471]|uniref:hypothetical protein n=1 Tax=Streptomyces sp. NPDC058471 TaxID=3346516 RepID=UPI0036681955
MVQLANDFRVLALTAGAPRTPEGWLKYGFAVRADPEEAPPKAFAEAYTLQKTSHMPDNPAVARFWEQNRPCPLIPRTMAS